MTTQLCLKRLLARSTCTQCSAWTPGSSLPKGRCVARRRCSTMQQGMRSSFLLRVDWMIQATPSSQQPREAPASGSLAAELLAALTSIRVGARRLQFLLESLQDLSRSLEARGSKLTILRGKPVRGSAFACCSRGPISSSPDPSSAVLSKVCNQIFCGRLYSSSRDPHRSDLLSPHCATPPDAPAGGSLPRGLQGVFLLRPAPVTTAPLDRTGNADDRRPREPEEEHALTKQRPS